jgi:hypothetical protein
MSSSISGIVKMDFINYVVKVAALDPAKVPDLFGSDSPTLLLGLHSLKAN